MAIWLCFWWVRCCACDIYDLRLSSLMKPFHRSFEDSQVFKLHAPWNSKIFVYSSRKLWFNKSWDHIAQRAPWESLWSSSWLCIFISWSHLCLYPYIYVGAVFPLYQKVFKSLPCFFLSFFSSFHFVFFFWTPHSPIEYSKIVLDYFLREVCEKFLSCQITRQNLQG